MSRTVLAALTLTLLTLDLPAGRGGYDGPAPYSVTPLVGHALVKVQGDRILIREYALLFRTEAYQRTRRVVIDGQARDVKEIVNVTKASPQEMFRHAAARKVRALDADGQKVGPEALAPRLQKETHVLVAFDGQDVDPALLKLLKKGTLVLILDEAPEREDLPRPRSERAPGQGRVGIPRGMQPHDAAANIDDKGTIHVQFASGKTVVETAYRESDTGGRVEKIPVQVKNHFFSLQMQSLDSKAVPAFGVDGRPVAANALPRLLKKSTPVLVSWGGKQVDPFYLEIFQEGTLVLLLPSPPGTHEIGDPSPPPPPSGEPLEPRRKSDKEG